MSYDIIYDKQFIDLKNGTFIPLVLSGSNNSYDHNGKRSRSWGNFTYIIDWRPWGTPDEFEEAAEKHLQRTISANPRDSKITIMKNYGSYLSLQIGSTMHASTFGMYKGIFKTGCNKALPLETLMQEGLRLHIWQATYEQDKFESRYGHKPESYYPKKTEELIALITKFRMRNEPFHLSFLFANEEHIRRIRWKYFPKKRRAKQKVDHYYCVYAMGLGYVAGLGKRNMYYGYHASSARKFKTEKQAENYKNKLSQRGFSSEFRVRKENSEALI